MKTGTGGRILAAAGFLFVLVVQVFAQSAALTVVAAKVERDKLTSQPVLAIRIAKESSVVLAALTRGNIGRKVELRVDGKVLSAPVIREPILGTELQISGDGTAADFDAIAKRLLSGGVVEVVVVP
jgi:preprotein translocase subunit SecD